MPHQPEVHPPLRSREDERLEEWNRLLEDSKEELAQQVLDLRRQVSQLGGSL